MSNQGSEVSNISRSEQTAERLYPEQVHPENPLEVKRVTESMITSPQEKVAVQKKAAETQKTHEERLALGDTTERSRVYAETIKGSLDQLKKMPGADPKEVEANGKTFTALFGSIHTEPAEAKAIMEIYVADAQKRPDEATLQARYNQTLDLLQATWGKNYHDRIERVDHYLAKFPKIRTELGGALYHPKVYLALAKKVDRLYD